MRRSLLLLAALLALSAGPTPAHRQPTRPATPAAQTLRVAAVQMRSARNVEENVQHTVALLKQCAAEGVQVAVFPECSVSGYFADLIPRLESRELQVAEERIARACRELRISAVVGSPVRKDGKLFNSAIVIDEQGRVVERYHKIQLAEAWPDPGDHLSVFTLQGARCAVIICHDERYPELVRLPVLAGARVIFYLSHESPLQQESKLAPYRAQIQARAVENSVFIVHANAPANADATGSHGQSRVIAPDGNLVREASFFREEVLTATLDLRQANGAMAQRSLTRGVLGDWWRAGLERVRRLD
jgi:predicted amidohydrolase